MKRATWPSTTVPAKYPMWFWQTTLLFVAPSSRVLVYGRMTPSHAEYQVAYFVSPVSRRRR